MNTLVATREFVRIISDNEDRLIDILERAKKSKSPGFYLCVGSTKSSDIEGISAAGSNAEARRLTPRFDAEALVLGETTDGESIPVSPAGIVSPVVLTRASLKVMESDIRIVDCGSFMPPRIDTIQAGNLPAQCVSTGAA
ncbi:MAG: hypothetical protein K8F91_12725, partial [Candidatus Obscuribacterales bacterium]|nr:hypothetical protein [Candidatus Obscuribacterales bacterium]